MAKRKISSWIAKILTICMVLNLFVTSLGAQATVAYANITSTVATDADAVNYYEIRLGTDQTIEIGTAYWERNLQQFAPANAEGVNVEEHNALAQTIRDNILINGMSVDDALASADDKSTSTSILAVSTTLYIRVKKADNPYHLDPTGYFSLEIKEGITLNGYEIGSKKYYVTPNKGKDWNTNFSEIGTTASIVSARFKEGVITLTADSNIGTESISTAEDKILIDGVAVNLADISAVGNEIIINYDTTEQFEMQIQSGIVLNGKAIMPARFSFVFHDASATISREVSVNEGALTALMVDVHDQASGYCTSHGESYNPAQWLIDIIYSQQDLNLTALSHSYYERHLQASTYSDMICSKIHLNNKTLAECISEDSRDIYTAVHVRISSNASGYVILQIAVPKDNTFGFDGEKDFTVRIDDGIIIENNSEDMPLSPATVSYTSIYATGELIENAAKQVAFSDDTMLIRFNYGFNTNPFRNAAQAANYPGATAIDQETAIQLCEHIKVNGEILAELFSRMANNYAFYINYKTESNGDGSISLKIANDTLKSELGDSFTVDFVEGLVLDGYSIPAMTCMTDGQIIIGKPSFEGHSLLLADAIGVVFNVDLSSMNTFAKNNCFMNFSVNGQEKTVDFAQARLDSSYYLFTCYVNSAQMADTITATLHYGDGSTIENTYSVETYIQYVVAHPEIYDSKTVALAKAMADYGYYAQPFLAANNGWTIGTDHAEMTTHYLDDYSEVMDGYVSDLSEKRFSKSITGTGIAEAKYNLNLDSNTGISVFFKPESQVSVTSVEATHAEELEQAEPAVTDATLQNDGRYRIWITGISVLDLDKFFTVSGIANSEFSVSVCGLSYVRSILGNVSSSATAKNAMTALYRYHLAANAYVDSE